MSIEKSLKTSQEAQARVKQIKATIRKLKQKIQKIEREGEVAPSRMLILGVLREFTEKLFMLFLLGGKRLKQTFPPKKS